MCKRKLPDRNPNHPEWQGLFIGFVWGFALFSKLLYPLLTLSSWQLELPSNQYCKVKATPSFALDSSIHLLFPAIFALEGKQKRTGKNYLSAIRISWSNTALALATCCAVSWIWPNDGPHSNQAQARGLSLAEERRVHQITAPGKPKHTVLLDLRHLFSREEVLAVTSRCLTADRQGNRLQQC